MPSTRIVRPVWRKFQSRFFARAVKWVRDGGHAVVVNDDNKLELLLGVDATGELTEFALWALLSVEQRRARLVTEGPAKGLRQTGVGRHARFAVLDWCERDSVFDAATRALDLDCLACAACCHDSNVLLDQDDLDRFVAGGREDLTTSAYIKRSRDGKVRLRFLGKGPCQHLARDNKCRIYALRPFNCSVFPAGSEACLAARESTHAWRDDLTPLAPPRPN
ncbi:MAG: YkgJ family cysteine cluster protein [Polyangiaceae bacterium]